MAENTNTERAKFEAWYMAKIRESLPSDGDGWSDDQIRESFMGFAQDRGYRSSSAQQAWGAWQARASLSLPAAGQEPIYAFRRKGLRDFCTCDADRYAELSAKPNLFEVRVFYAAPQPAAPVAGKEPVAHLWQHGETGRTRIVLPDMIVDADASWQVVGPLYLDAAPQPAVAAGWVMVDERLPDPGKPVLLDIGKKLPIRAMWAAKHTVQAADDDTDWGEYDEATDTYYCPEGWYEWNEHEDTNWAVSATPRAWATLPPTSSADSRKGE